jgi:hypothetical protein
MISRVYVSVTNNNGFWTGWLDLLTPSCTISLNHNKLQLTVNLQPNPSSLTAEDSLHSRSRSTTDFFVWVLRYDQRSVGKSVLEQSTLLGLTTRSILLSDSCGFVGMGRPLWREDGSVVYNCSGSSPAQSFSGPSPVGLVDIFYCLRFETSLFVASYDSQGHGGGIRHRLHTGDWLTSDLRLDYLYSLEADP